MAYKKFVRSTKKIAKNVRRNIKKRYFRGKGYKKPKLVQMAKDITMLKNMVNAEKKRVTFSHIVQVGQNGTGITATNPTNSGHQVVKDLFYTPPVGTGGTTPHNTRMGDSIKTCSYHIDFRVIGQNLSQPVRGTIYLVKFNHKVISTYNDLNELVLTPSIFDTKYDIHSNLNYEEMKEFTIIAKRNVYVPADQTAGTTNTKYTKMGGKLGFHQRYETGTNQIDLNELGLIYLADDGTSIASAGNRQLSIEAAGTMYFYDN